MTTPLDQDLINIKQNRLKAQLETALDIQGKIADQVDSMIKQQAQEVIEETHNLRTAMQYAVIVGFIAAMIVTGINQYEVIQTPEILKREITELSNTITISKSMVATAPTPTISPPPTPSVTEFSGLGFSAKLNNTEWSTIFMIITLILGTYGGVKLINQFFAWITKRFH